MFSSGIPKSKSHFSKLKKAYNETTSKVSTVVQQGFRASGHNQTRGIELSCPPVIAHKDAILDISSSEARTGIFASASMDKTAKIWVIIKLDVQTLNVIYKERVRTMLYKIYWSSRRSQFHFNSFHKTSCYNRFRKQFEQVLRLESSPIKIHETINYRRNET